MSFYEFNQNNSGGSFQVNDKVCHRLFIEADTPDEATEIAEGLGVYFNGCDDGMDCPCCGDRWYPLYRDDAVKFPLEYGKDQIFENIQDYAQYLADEYGWTSPDGRIYYKDGQVTECYGKNVK